MTCELSFWFLVWLKMTDKEKKELDQVEKEENEMIDNDYDIDSEI